MSTGGSLPRYRARLRLRRKRESPLGVALATVTGFGTGLLAGVILGGWLGAVNPDRVRRLLAGKREPETIDPERLQRDVLRALRSTAPTRRLNLSARALEGGLVELTGIVPDERTRQAAGEAAERIAGADLVVNRILVQGRDVPPGHTAPPKLS